MYEIRCENWKDEWVAFEGTLAECVENFYRVEDENIADDQEERCYIVDENGRELSWLEIEEMEFSIA